MKQFFLTALLTLFFVSCIKKEDGFPDNGGVVDTNAEWVVYSYQKNTNVETTTYNSYIVRFAPSGDMIASKNGFSYTGRWRKMTDTFRVELFAEAPFAQLNKDWKVNYINSGEIDLKFTDFNDTSFVTFRKL